MHTTANDRIQSLANLLNQAGEVHHVYFSDRDGADDDWASFYSEWLLTRSKFPEMLGRRPVRSDLTRELVVAEEAYTAAKASEPWPTWYAARLVAKYG